MGRGRTNPVMVSRVAADGTTTRVPDRVVAEEPMEIRLDDHLVTITMRTPGHDYELAAGFLFTEGLLHGAPVQQVRYCATGSAVETGFNIVSVDTGGHAPEPTPRLGTTTSSCGLCGSEQIDQLLERLAPLPTPPVPIDVALALAVAEKAKADQELFAATGSVHAAAAYDLDTGAIAVLREDVGRHNAVDKVVGRLLLDDQLPSHAGLFVSGRVSFEIVQKAWAGGFRQIIAVSGPTNLAVETAARANIALAGFLRHDGANLYT